MSNDKLGLNEFADETFGLYMASTSWSFFHDFAEALESLSEFRMMSRVAVEAAIADLPAAMEREIAILEEAEKAGDDVFVDAATYDFWSDRLDRAPEHFSTFVCVGITAALFANFEKLLDAMVEGAATQLGQAVEYDPRPLPTVDKRLLFLERTCGVVIPLSREQRRRLDVIRETRNRLVHSLGTALSESLKKRLSELVPPTAGREFELDDRFVVAALRIVADIVRDLEAAYEARFGT
jgi:hypothetical protein